MKKTICILMVLVLAVSMTLTLSGCFKSYDSEINVFNWGENISIGEDGSMDVIAEFERRKNGHVHIGRKKLFLQPGKGPAPEIVIGILNDYADQWPALLHKELLGEGVIVFLLFNDISSYTVVTQFTVNVNFFQQILNVNLVFLCYLSRGITKRMAPGRLTISKTLLPVAFSPSRAQSTSASVRKVRRLADRKRMQSQPS